MKEGPDPTLNPAPGRAAVPQGLEESLIRFVHILRHLGIPVNPAEAVDALGALALVDLADRAQVKSALRSTLVKGQSESVYFDRAFDLFFAPPEVRQARVEEYRRSLEGPVEDRRKARTELVFQGHPIELTPEQVSTYARLGEVQQARLREFLAETSTGNNVDQSFAPLVESIVRGHLERLGTHMEPNRRPQVELTGDEELDTVIESALAGDVEAGSGALLWTNMKDIEDADLPRARRLIRRLAARLASRLSRRYRETRKRRRPNMRRTIRSNIRYGGVFFDLRYRERKTSRPRLLLICDVSGSMARYTTFILEFIFGLEAAVRGVEAFVFSEELERITDRVASDVAIASPAAAPRGGNSVLEDIRERLTGAFMEAAAPPVRRRAASPDRRAATASPNGRARAARSGDRGPARGFAANALEVISESRVWGRGTDLGTALAQLLQDYARHITRDTVVIIVSDTKTLGADKAAGLLAELRPRVRDILWLNTLPRDEWPNQKAVGLFARYVNMHECQTLAHLEKVLRIGVGRHFRRT